VSIVPGCLLSLACPTEFLKSDTNDWSYCYVAPGYLLCIEEMDMTKEWTAAGVASAAGRAVATRREEYSKIYDLAREEYEKTGRIHGYKFLCPEGKNYIWLSHYDVEYLAINDSR